MDISGISAAVTGGGHGIGRAIAHELARAGAKVAVGDIDEAAASAVAAEIGGIGVRLDVSDRASFEAFLDAAEQAHGPLGLMVNNAGIDWIGAFHEEPDEVTRREIDVNLYGTIAGSKLALGRMLPRGSGHLVNVASGVGRVPLPGSAVYSATKHGVVGLTESLRLEYRGRGIGFTVVQPAQVETAMLDGQGRPKALPVVTPEDVAQRSSTPSARAGSRCGCRGRRRRPRSSPRSCRGRRARRSCVRSASGRSPATPTSRRAASTTIGRSAGAERPSVPPIGRTPGRSGWAAYGFTVRAADVPPSHRNRNDVRRVIGTVRRNAPRASVSTARPTRRQPPPPDRRSRTTLVEPPGRTWPHSRARRAARALRPERRREDPEGRLAAPAEVLHPRLPAAAGRALRLVLPHVPGEVAHARVPPGHVRRLREVARLLRGRDAEHPVGRLGLVRVLVEVDRQPPRPARPQAAEPARRGRASRSPGRGRRGAPGRHAVGRFRRELQPVRVVGEPVGAGAAEPAAVAVPDLLEPASTRSPNSRRNSSGRSARSASSPTTRAAPARPRAPARPGRRRGSPGRRRARGAGSGAASTACTGRPHALRLRLEPQRHVRLVPEDVAVDHRRRSASPPPARSRRTARARA